MSEHNYKEVWQYAMNQIHEDYKKNGQETEFKLWFNMDYIEDTLTDITVSVASEFLWQTMVSKGNIRKVEQKICELTGQPSIQLKRIIKKPIVQEQPASPSPVTASAVSIFSSSNSFNFFVQ